MPRRATIVVCLLVGALLAPLHGQTRLDPELLAVLDQLLEAFNDGDAVRVSAFYAEDTVVMPQGEDAVEGRAAVRARFARQIDRGMTNLRIMPLAATVAGDHGFVVASYLIDVPDGSGGMLTIPARATTVFRRIDGEWRIVYDMLNAGAPPAP